MFEKIKNSLIILLVIAVAFIFYLNSKNNKKMGFITTAKVFDEFALKKELEVDLKKIQLTKQAFLDSIKLKVQTMALKSNDALDPEINEYKKLYLIKEKQFNDESEELFQQYNDKIWKQLNQYIEDFGKEYKFDYVFGSAGQGNIMYASSGENLTDEVIKYVNGKYTGKK
ncbi:MAG: OmpH family outer membrane protein [Bacteroidetes bacterium]|nr:OmpH family outer membrane protein [Bacteroidota bacterium]